ncbi:MAG: hypothetical protein MMC33_009353 [Icmadophila ericetorum]|nr:hypothetical protein [Icmadophila ericetorum]
MATTNPPLPATSGGPSRDTSSSMSGSPTSPTLGSNPSSPTRKRGSTGSSRLRAASLKMLESNPPRGMWAATGEAVAKAPSLADIRRGSFGSGGWEGDGQRRNSINSPKEQPMSRSSSHQSPVSSPIRGRGSSFIASPVAKSRVEGIEEDHDDFPDLVLGRGEMTNQSFVRGLKTKVAPVELDSDNEEPPAAEKPPKYNDKMSRMLGNTATGKAPSQNAIEDSQPEQIGPDADGIYPNGYQFPPKRTWGEATIIGLKALWAYTLTPLGFFVVLYGLNVVAWGGMLFLLLCNAAPQMCYSHSYPGKQCNNINSPRRIWIEIDSQILNALFCVTGFGLAPWRFRDWYYLLKFRLCKNFNGLRTLAGIHRGWFRLPGSTDLPIPKLSSSEIIDPSAPIDSDPSTLSNSAIALPPSKSPDPPLTGIRAPATALWKMDYVIWAFVLNTFLQCVLCAFMWHYDRQRRPSWSTGLFVALACVVAGCGGLMIFLEGKKVKNVEGVPVDVVERVRDIEGAMPKSEKKGLQVVT